MIHDLDDTLKELLVQKVPLDPNAIDIKFEVPNKDDWNPKPNKPTINCFLYDIRENHELRSNERYLTRNGTTGTEKLPLLALIYPISSPFGQPMSPTNINC